MGTAAFRRLLAVMALAGMACIATTAYAKPSGSWRIVFNHVTDNDGSITLRIAPLEGTPIDVETKVPAKTSENSVAQLLSASLKATLGTKDFRVGVDDGESVIIKKRGKTKKFELTIVNNSMTGIEVTVKRE